MLSAKMDCRALFSACCEVSNESNPTNSIQPHTLGGIYLRTYGNIQGSCYFFCLIMANVLKRQTFMEMPLPYLAIKKVEAWAETDNAPGGREFLKRKKNQFYSAAMNMMSHW